MESLNISKLTRNSKKVTGIFKDGKGDQLFVTKDCYILVPARYINRNLMVIEDTVSLIGFFALVTDNVYTVSNVPTFITVSPYSINDIDIDGTPYKKLLFKANTVFIEDTKLVKMDNFIYSFFDEFFIKGHIPWFMEYEDLTNVFKFAKDYADSNIGNNLIVMEILVSVIGRNAKDKLQYFRTSIKNRKDLKTNKPSYVPMQSVYYSFSNTTNKLVGSYMSKGIVSSLVNPADKVENIEKLLRT